MRVEAKFTSQEAVHNAQEAIQSAGFSPEKMRIDTQSFIPRTEISQTQTVKNASSAAIMGATLGGMVGLSLSVINSNVPNSVTFVANNPYILTFLITLAGSIIGAVGFGIIGAITGINIPKNVPNTYKDKVPDNYLLIVEGDKKDVEALAHIIKQQGGQVR